MSVLLLRLHFGKQSLVFIKFVGRSFRKSVENLDAFTLTITNEFYMIM